MLGGRAPRTTSEGYGPFLYSPSCAADTPLPGYLGVDAGVPLGGERASGHPAWTPGLLLRKKEEHP